MFAVKYYYRTSFMCYADNERAGVVWTPRFETVEEALGYAERGLLIIDNEGLKLTEQGIDISNSIMSLFV